MEAMSPFLTANQVSLLKLTFRALNTQRLGQRFYDKLFQLHPELKPMFSANLDDQITKIISVLELVIYSFEEKAVNQFGLQESVLLPLRDLGKKHVQKGVKQPHYPIANSILLDSLSEELGTMLTAEGLAAWKLALDHLSFAMLNPSVEPPSQLSRSLRDSFQLIKKLIRSK
jgi:nitric oxide dioxygenase